MLDSIDLETRIREILDAHRGQEGSLLPILHDVQEAYGYVPEAALPIIAADLQITKAEAHGVMTFYHDFREKPAGRKVLKLCRAESCKSMGADALAAEVQAKLGLDWHETSADGAVTLEPIFCLGLCACGPAAMVDGKLVGRATAEALVAKVKA
ncbi:formate dehydrogenase subunit gamma [Xinfangfangia sp. CPCC 101601]|uniref:Formate dehydrogenase subunit gamma n=1 Tax=Pseudogemmobacter lacusdianii TaxID=3069608 RepID=A0ABU0VX76_9RHOB|nr:formate dehydrogenase subunit gamma [Xinfangfangia sp. CPCC 101601]MDQ2066218.1 formate dehydrogenase subunit gamma [Xinfangfangia sp. CPCC 101601]